MLENIRRRSSGRVVAAVTATVLTAAAPAVTAPTAQAATARSFSCTGSTDIYTNRTVTALVTSTGQPYHVTVIDNRSAATLSTRTRRAVKVGASTLHAGYVEWNVTGPNQAGDLFHLSIPPVLPGAGGFFDADLEQFYAGGANGSAQIPMFDCTVTGGSTIKVGARTFTCSGGNPADFTDRVVTGTLSSGNVPTKVRVTDSAATPYSTNSGVAAKVGASWLHTGYVDWNVTGADAVAAGDEYHLHLPPTLPAKGGYFDADLEVLLQGGASGSLQNPMFDCTVA